MPTYEFRCDAGHTTDRFFSTISGSPSGIECPVCGEPAARQISGGIGLHFKGSGFYITDYGKDGKKPRTPEKPEAAESGGAKDPGKTETAGGTGGKESPGDAKPSGEAKPSQAKPEPSSASKKPKNE